MDRKGRVSPARRSGPRDARREPEHCASTGPGRAAGVQGCRLALNLHVPPEALAIVCTSESPRRCGKQSSRKRPVTREASVPRPPVLATDRKTKLKRWAGVGGGFSGAEDTHFRNCTVRRGRPVMQGRGCACREEGAGMTRGQWQSCRGCPDTWGGRVSGSACPAFSSLWVAL